MKSIMMEREIQATVATGEVIEEVPRMKLVVYVYSCFHHLIGCIKSTRRRSASAHRNIQTLLVEWLEDCRGMRFSPAPVHRLKHIVLLPVIHVP
jgi:hypothetical protein